MKEGLIFAAKVVAVATIAKAAIKTNPVATVLVCWAICGL